MIHDLPKVDCMQIKMAAKNSDIETYLIAQMKDSQLMDNLAYNH